MLPVVEARAPHLAFVQRESERLDEVQRRAGSETRAACVARIPMNLRMDKDNVDRPVGH